MNIGIKSASGLYYYFMGSDDRLADNLVLQKVYSSLVNSRLDKTDILLCTIKYDNGLFFYSRWGWELLIRNTAHHQGCFYSESLFSNDLFSERFQILSDYEFNLKQFFKKVNVKKGLDINTAICGSSGISKRKFLIRAKEELRIKKKLPINSFLKLFVLFVVVGKIIIVSVLRRLKLHG